MFKFDLHILALTQTRELFLMDDVYVVQVLVSV